MIGSGQDPAEIKSRAPACLSANPDTGAALTLGPNSVDPTIPTLEENGMAGELYFGAFDLGEEIVKCLKSGVIECGVDQQPFLQAYLSVVVPTNHERYGAPPDNNINSSPSLAPKDGLAMVEQFAGAISQVEADIRAENV